MSNIETQQVKRIKSAPGAETEKPGSWLAWVYPSGVQHSPTLRLVMSPWDPIAPGLDVWKSMIGLEIGKDSPQLLILQRKLTMCRPMTQLVSGHMWLLTVHSSSQLSFSMNFGIIANPELPSSTIFQYQSTSWISRVVGVCGCAHTHTCTHGMRQEHIFIIDMVVLHIMYTTLIAYTTSCIFLIKNWATI